MATKIFSRLTGDDLRANPIWELLLNGDEDGNLLAETVEQLPVSDLAHRIVAVNFWLADGERLFGYLGNVQLKNNWANSHVITTTFDLPGGWFTLARYFDPDYELNGPPALAKLLGKHLDSIFPIKYDISSVAVGDESVLRSEIAQLPMHRLSSDEIIMMAVDIAEEP